MGTQTLAQFQTDLASALGNRTLDAAQSARWINAAYREFGYSFKFPEFMGEATIATVQGQTDYNLPADFRSFSNDPIVISAPNNLAGGTLQKETRAMFRRSWRFETTQSQAVAQYYHRFANKLVLRPAPNGTVQTLEFDYWKKITALTAPTDVSVLSDDWDDAILRGAIYRGHMNFGEHDRMINIFNMFLSLIRSRVEAEDLEEFPDGGISYIQNEFDARVR